MMGPEVHSLSRHFTNLVGRDVKFTKSTIAPDRGVRWIYAIYEVTPVADPTGRRPMVIKASLELLGSLAGSLVGLPKEEVTRHLMNAPLEELMRDAIYEILNVASGVIANNSRAVLIGMSVASDDVKGDAALVLTSPAYRADFNVVVQDYSGGQFVVMG